MKFNWRLIKRWFRFKWQRLTRGWDDSDTWSMDYTIAKLVLPRLKRFKELNNGHPVYLTEEEWDEIIEQMIFAMKIIVDSNGGSFIDITEEEQSKMEAGLQLFGIYFRDLWW